MFEQSSMGAGGFTPEYKKRLPFPIENIEEDLGNVYFELDKIRKRIEVSKRNNVVNLSQTRLKRLAKMQYKINTAMHLVKTLTKDLDTFWIN
jgi:regulator of replication initiation timing